MSNGLGAGFAALTLLAVLAGLALAVALVTAGAYAAYRRRGHVPGAVRYLVVTLGVGACGVAGFGVLAFADEAPVLAGLFALTVVLPLVVGGVRLRRTTGLAPADVAATAAMAWGLAFLLGLPVVFGVMAAVGAALGIPPAASGRRVVAWVASAVGGVAVALGVVLVGDRLVAVVRATDGAGAGE